MTSDHDPDTSSPTPAGDPDLDLEIDDLATALQLDRAQVLSGGHEDGEIEEVDEIVEVPEEDTNPRAGFLYLVVDGQTHTVYKDRFVIGRVSSQCDLAIIDANVSRQHCAIERRDGHWYAEDLGSTNGIQIDGERVDHHPIAEGDVLVLSGHRVSCTFEAPARQSVEPEPEPAPRATMPAGATARLSPVPRRSTQPMPAPAPAFAPEPPAAPELPAKFEDRVEMRLAALAEDVSQLRAAMEHLVGQFESLKGVDALAQVIQRRLQQAKR